MWSRQIATQSPGMPGDTAAISKIVVRREQPGKIREETQMTLRNALAASTAVSALAGTASADTMKIGITQNNVGVDSYQTTYEKAFIAAADANAD